MNLENLLEPLGSVMLHTCFIFEVSLIPIPLEESTIFVTVPINHAIRAKHMGLSQSVVRDFSILPDLPYLYSLMAIEFEPQVPFLYATYSLYVIYILCPFTTNACIGWLVLCIEDRF